VSAFALVALPTIGAALVGLFGRRAGAVAVAAIGTLVVTLAAGAWAAVTQPALAWRWSPIIELGVGVEAFGRVMVVLVPLVALPIVGYAVATEPDGRRRLVAFLLAFVAAMLLLVTAADFVTLLVAWELVGFVSWVLIGHRWRDADAASSATRAFITTRLGDLGLFVAAGIAFAATGSFSFDALRTADASALVVVAGGVLVAAAAKSAQLPFSPWLFAAMAGPTPVSALLHSATLVAAGAYLLVRLAPELAAVAWFGPAVAAVGLSTALAGGLVALLQLDAKRALAGSTSAQYGLMFVAVGAGFAAAGAAQLVTHAAFKSLLFLGAGVAIHATGTGALGAMGLGRRLPRAAILSAVGALALAGVPPLGGGWSKEAILAGALEASAWLGVGALVASLLTALYAGRYQLLAYGMEAARDGSGDERQSAERRDRYLPRPAELAALAVLAGVTLVLSVLWLPGVGGAVEELVGTRLPEGSALELVMSVVAIAIAFAVVWWIGRRGALETVGLAPAVQAAAADWLGLPRATDALVVRPTLALSTTLARLDDRVVDAGVRGVAALARAVSRIFARRGEWTFDGAVHGLWALALGAAGTSRTVDDRGVDAVVEESARGVGAAGTASRRLQTGQSHHYYVAIVAGVAVMLGLLLWTQ